ncbi:cytochrome P450 6B6-like [Galleria mellonella]|uniref:unspecific monooxygenase n=1 Tax=Galleria mellonella TaxID=7137 RepID=A0ABM3MKF5_GALME|nr:cytochrome P450 6B6-like [Galleria mellonella]
MIILLLILCVMVIYFYSNRNHDYWSKRNIKHDPPLPLIGNHFQNQFALKSITDITVELYNKYPKERVVGYYRWSTPELIIKDPKIVRHILNVDFAHFYPRGLGRNPNVEPLHANLFHADNDTWKLLRQRITPAFTTAKLKKMFPLIVNCAEKLQVVGKDIVSRGGECDVRELMARFTTEFIGACGFGIEMDTINNEHSLFRDLGKLIFNRTITDVIRLMIWEGFPISRNYLPVTSSDIENIITDIVTKIRAQRNYKPSGRNDFIDLLLELESKGKIKGDSIERRNPDGTPIEVEMEMNLKYIIAQVFVFFAAGFETSSSATSFTLHELAYNPDIQTKIQEEIDQVLLKYDNKLCYDAVTEMSLLDMSFKEAMRIFPSLGILNRVCAKRYTIPELNVTIDPGVKIIIPIQAIQNDEKYFDNPTEFRPERFTPEAVKSRHHYTYLPFGEGPRACIGARLGHMQSLAGLAAILRTFTVEPSDATLRRPVVNPRSNVVQGVKEGIPLKLRLR